MNLAFWFLVVVLVGGAAAYWWFFMKNNGDNGAKQGGKDGENHVDLSQDSTTEGAVTPEEPASTEGEDLEEDNTPPSV